MMKIRKKLVRVWWPLWLKPYLFKRCVLPKATFKIQLQVETEGDDEGADVMAEGAGGRDGLRRSGLASP